MAQRRSTSTRSRAAAAVKSRGRSIIGPKAMGRLEKSLDAAEIALRDLRRELGKGGTGMVKDLDRTIKDSRKNLRSLNRTVLRDLEKLQKAATKGTSPRSKAAAGSKKAATSRKASTKRKASTARKSTATRAKKSTSRSKAGARRSTAKK